MFLPRALRVFCQRRFLVPLMVLALVAPWVLKGVVFNTNPKPYEWRVDPKHQELVHTYVQSVLKRECRPAFARKGIKTRIPTSTPVTEPFLRRDTHLSDTVFQYPPPFGFLDLQDKLKDVLRRLSPSPTQEQNGIDCQRCVVVGNGGILRGLELGALIDKFDIVIRLNSGPVQNYTKDVGRRSSIRMSYPEGSPKVWEDMDPKLKFVAVIYKSVDFNWLNAMISKQKVSLWNWLFFWQRVPDEIPIKLSQFYVLNPEIIRETALDLLQYPKPKFRLWGWDQNVPTLGVSALNLASYLCDEVSLAGFGYNLSQRDTPLHYYDTLPMSAMLTQEMHNVDQETALLQSLVAEGTILDLTGGIHCTFCPS